MRKFLWLLFLIPLFMIRAHASTYYSDYGDYTLSKDVVLESDTINVNKIKYYNWYKSSKTLLGYGLYESSGQFIKEDCYTTGSVSTTVKPLEHESRFIESRNTYVYTMPNKVRYLHLTNLQGSYRSIRITELMVLIDGLEIDYDYTCEGCWGEFDNHIHNGIWAENESYIANGGNLIIDLKSSYDVNKVNLIFYLFDMGTTTKTYNLGFSNNPLYVYGSKSYSLDFQLTSANEALRLSYNVYNMGLNTEDWTYIYASLDRLDNGFVSENIETEYRYTEKWCRKYIDNAIYSNTYSPEPILDYNIKDENDYIEYYNYRVREKIEVEDNIIFNSYTSDINDYIKTNSAYSLEGFIDLNKNGAYLVKIKTAYTTIDVNVIVDIINNDLIEKDKEISRLKETITSLNTQFNLIKETYLKNISDLNNKIISLGTTNLYYQDELNSLLKEKEDITNKYNNDILKLNNEIDKLEIDTSLQEDYDILLKNIKEYQENIVLLQKNNNSEIIKMNEAYNNKFLDLKKNNDELNEDIKTVIDHEEELTSYYENKVSSLEEENKALVSKNILNNSLEATDDSSKINDYILQIKSQKRSIWIVLTTLSIFIITFIYYKLKGLK